MSPKRILQLCVLSTLSLSATAVFAEEAAAPKTAAAVSSSQVKTEVPSPQQGFSFADLGIPDPTNRSCTASTSCATLGGSPIMCTGLTCVFNTSWVDCDGTVTYCTCNPSNITGCRDPVGFCNCWDQSPTNGWGNCRKEFCLN